MRVYIVCVCLELFDFVKLCGNEEQKNGLLLVNS